jgi:hypothetical protein
MFGVVTMAGDVLFGDDTLIGPTTMGNAELPYCYSIPTTTIPPTSVPLTTSL